MMEPIYIADYNYPLPDERIAKYPLAERDQSKLLVYRQGTITEEITTGFPGITMICQLRYMTGFTVILSVILTW